MVPSCLTTSTSDYWVPTDARSKFSAVYYSNNYLLGFLLLLSFLLSTGGFYEVIAGILVCWIVIGML